MTIFGPFFAIFRPLGGPPRGPPPGRPGYRHQKFPRDPPPEVADRAIFNRDFELEKVAAQGPPLGAPLLGPRDPPPGRLGGTTGGLRSLSPYYNRTCENESEPCESPLSHADRSADF